jgi:hypothetical protein
VLRMRTTRRRISWPSALHSTRNQSHANTARMKNAPHFWEGLSLVLIFQKGGWGACAVECGRRNAPVVVEFAAASGRRSTAATVKFMMLGVPRLPPPNLWILQGWRAHSASMRLTP